MNKLTRQEIILAIIAAAGEEGMTGEQIQASAFLFGEEHPDLVPDDWYTFEKTDTPFQANQHVSMENSNDCENP